MRQKVVFVPLFSYKNPQFLHKCAKKFFCATSFRIFRYLISADDETKTIILSAEKKFHDVIYCYSNFFFRYCNFFFRYCNFFFRYCKFFFCSVFYFWKTKLWHNYQVHKHRGTRELHNHLLYWHKNYLKDLPGNWKLTVQLLNEKPFRKDFRLPLLSSPAVSCFSALSTTSLGGSDTCSTSSSSPHSSLASSVFETVGSVSVSSLGFFFGPHLKFKKRCKCFVSDILYSFCTYAEPLVVKIQKDFIEMTVESSDRVSGQSCVAFHFKKAGKILFFRNFFQQIV